MFILMFFEEIFVKIGFHRLGIHTSVNPIKYPSLRAGPKTLSCLLFPKFQKNHTYKVMFTPQNQALGNSFRAKNQKALRCIRKLRLEFFCTPTVLFARELNSIITFRDVMRQNLTYIFMFVGCTLLKMDESCCNSSWIENQPTSENISRYVLHFCYVHIDQIIIWTIFMNFVFFVGPIRFLEKKNDSC